MGKPMEKKKRRFRKTAKVSKAGAIYTCPQCQHEELMPQDVLDYFDEINPPTPFSEPHRFTCEKCEGIMSPKK